MIINPRLVKIIILIGDIHWGVYSNSREWVDNTKSFFYGLLIPFLKKLKEKGYTKDDVQVIFEGDWNNDKQEVSTVVSNEATDAMEEVAALYDTWSLVGNHDTPLKNSVHINSLRSLKNVENCQIVVEPTVLKCANGESILLNSFVGDKDKELQILNSFDTEYLIAHTAIEGFFYEGIAVDGKKHNKISDFAKFKRVYSGHIHSKQEKDNILFTGLPTHVRESEYKNTPGFHFIDFIKQKEIFIENKISSRFKYINLSDIMNMTVADANAFVKNSYVRILMPSEIMYKLNVNSVNEVLEGYREIEVKTISQKTISQKTVGQVPESAGGNSDKPISTNTVAVDVQEKIMQYIDQLETVNVKNQKIEISQTLKEKLKPAMQQLYKAAEQKAVDEPLEF